MWLTEGVGRSGSQRRGLTTTTGGGAEAVLAEGDDAAVLQAFGPLGSALDVAAEGFGPKFGTHMGRVGGECFGVLPGAKAKP